MTGAIVGFPGKPLRPDIGAADQLLPLLFVTVRAIEMKQGRGDSRENERGLLNALAVAFLSIGQLLGVPRELTAAMIEHEKYWDDDGRLT